MLCISVCFGIVVCVVRGCSCLVGCAWVVSRPVQPPVGSRLHIISDVTLN